jgi:hypothetical protein
MIFPALPKCCSTSPSRKTATPPCRSVQGTRDFSELSLSPNPSAGTASRALDQDQARLLFCSGFPVISNYHTALHFRVLGANVAERLCCCYWSRTSADARAGCSDANDLGILCMEMRAQVAFALLLMAFRSLWLSGQSAAMLSLSMRRGRKVTFPLRELVARGSSSSSCLEVSHHGGCSA